MKKKITLTLFSIIWTVATILAQSIQPTKNLIVLIPDGTSVDVYSAARWFKKYRKEGNQLHIDPYICGTVNTFSSNAPIGDSAPTTSCYMTGITGQAGNISIYPVSDGINDLIALNPDSAYQPLTTIAEAMRIEQKKSIGLVATSQFPHATPADCAAHFYDRNNYPILAQQIAHNQVDVLIAGGTDYMTENILNILEKNKTTYIANDKADFDHFNGQSLWALFGEKATSYDIDRDPEKEPSIAEMTQKAIQLLNKNKNGFFLMVEGSKVDWAAHANDAPTIIKEFIAFDNAVGKAIDFAKKDGNTTVVVLSDHGNSGFSIGRAGLKKSYTRLSIKELFEGVDRIHKSADGLEKILRQTEPDNLSNIFFKYTGIQLTDEEVKMLLQANNYKKVAYDKVSDSHNLTHYITEIFKNRLPFGFTTGGHTGEEVLLSIYNPNGQRAMGNINNKQLHEYIYRTTGLKKTMKTITNENFAKHTDVFATDKYSISVAEGGYPILSVERGKKKLEIPAFSSLIKLNGKEIRIPSVTVFIDKNKTFYLPKSLVDLLK